MCKLTIAANVNDSSEKTIKKDMECIVHVGQENSYDKYIQLLGIFIGAVLIIWQSNRQHKSNFILQKENLKDELKLEIYGKLGGKIQISNDKTIDVSTYVRMTPINLDSYLYSVSLGLKRSPVVERTENYSEAYYSMGKSIVELITMLEEYEIASPSFKVFRMAIMSSKYDLDKIHMNLHAELLRCLPIDLNAEEQSRIGEQVLVSPALTQDKVKILKEVADEFLERIMDITCYLFDLRVEAQNTLLGGIFEHRVEGRNPVDPKYITIKTDKESLEKLERYFLEETAWGKNWQEAQSHCRDEFEKNTNHTD